MNADWPTNEEVAKVRRADCVMGGHRWRIIEQVGLGPTRLVCTNCGEHRRILDVDAEAAMLANEARVVTLTELLSCVGDTSHEHLVSVPLGWKDSVRNVLGSAP